MINYKLSIFSAILCIISSCSITKNQKKGTVNPEEFNYETTFTTLKNIIMLPVEINGVTKNFLFDTGADYSVVQRDSIFGKTTKISGASKRETKMGKEYISSMKIGAINFSNTIALHGDLIGLKEQIPDFGGLIGQPIINKANWFIDYPRKKIRITNQNIADNSFKTLEIHRENGTPYTYISINGAAYKVIIDFGSSSEFSLPKESKLAKHLLQQYKFMDNLRDRWTIGGTQKIKEKVGVLPLVKLGDMEFKNVITKINIQSQIRIGISFFKDYIIYIDNLENNYKIKKLSSI